MKTLLALLLLLTIFPLSTLSAAEADDGVIRFFPAATETKPLKGLEIRHQEATGFAPDTRAVPDGNKRLEVSLALGETADTVIRLLPAADFPSEFRVEQQYETSLSLTDSGPHMDLLDWRHHVSDWEPCQRLKENTFATRQVASEEFPTFSRAEIVAAVREVAKQWQEQGYGDGDRWEGLAAQCESAHTLPCAVGVSAVRVRILARQGAEEWRQVFEVVYSLPLGC